jgi:hypothetical protein
MKIEDNFLRKKVFDKLQTIMMGPFIDWHYQKTIDREEDVDKFMFIHLFYFNNVPTTFNGSSSIEILNSILEKIDTISLCRIKANLLTRTPNIIENTFHVDGEGYSEEKLKQLTTSIFYVNTNNGYTKFEDGTKVESVANRLVTFPANTKHKGSTCTDERTRVVINFNYFKY